MKHNTIQPPRRHCMVVHAHYPIGETRVEREARALVDRGYQVDLVCLRSINRPAVETIDGVTVYRLPVIRHKDGGWVVQLFEYLAFLVLASIKLTALHIQRRYHVVQVHNLPDFLVLAALAPKLTGAKVILDLHDLMPEFYAARFRTGLSSWPARLVRWQEWISCRFADHVITVTELWRQTLIKRGVPAGKVSVVMNVADDRYFFRSPAAQPAPKNGHAFSLIYHGNLTQRYGLDLAIRAVALVRDQIPDIRLIIHGWGDYRDALVSLARELALDQQIVFSNRALSTCELPELIRTADVGIVPYRRDVFTDGILPTKLMEYAALGIPAIASRTPAIAAYFDDTMVQFFDPDDPRDLACRIGELYNDRQRLAALAQGAERFNQCYSWKKVSADYVALVERLGASQPDPME